MTHNLMSESAVGRATRDRPLPQAIPAWLTDLYRERLPITVAYRSHSVLTTRVEDPFIINFPVLIECEDVAILGNVRHCLKSADGGYILGIKIHKVINPCRADVHFESRPQVRPATAITQKLTRAARLGGGTWRLLVPSIVELEG